MARHSRLAKAVAWPEQLRRVDVSGISISRFSARACGKGAENAEKDRRNPPGAEKDRRNPPEKDRRNTRLNSRKRTGVILGRGKGQA